MMIRAGYASALAVLIALMSLAAAAANYPDKPIRIIVPFAPGGGSDLVARFLQNGLEKGLGVPIIIDNRPGAGGTLGSTLAARSAPDGYTFLVTSASFTFSPSIYKDLAYDAIKDFTFITNISTTPLVLVVHPSMPVKNVKEFLSLARSRPGEVHYASGGYGSNIHLTTELFKYMAKVDLRHIPYKGGGPANIAVLTGEVQVVFTGVMSSKPFVSAGKMRAIAVTTKERSPVYPELPSIHEAGVPGYDKGGWTGMYAPARLPSAVTDKVYGAIARILKDPVVIERLKTDGLTPVGTPPAEFAAFVKAEIEEWAKLVKEMKL
jgi:tripartite-type tricarboxylate transporter receptor subunit TctC